MNDKTLTPSDVKALKYAAAAKALEYVEEGMKLGLGSGSTSAAFVELLGKKVHDGLNVTCTATSEAIANRARELHIPIVPLADIAPLDLAVDGADEADADLNLIKGGGAALTREKIVESSAKRFVVIAHDSKFVETLGKFPLPVEVVRFGHQTTLARIQAAITKLGYKNVDITLRMKDGEMLITDNGGVIYDIHFGTIKDVPVLANALSNVPGLVEHGLFTNMAEALILASAKGIVVKYPPKAEPKKKSAQPK